MKHAKHNPLPEETIQEQISVDYSEIYRNQEMKQLQKRLRKTRNTLLACSFVITAGGFLFWLMPEIYFPVRQFLFYILISCVFAFMALLSKTGPYKILLSALILSLALWGVEIMSGKADDILVAGSIHKLFIISLIVSSMHASKEAELIKKELHFS